jgi:hypothetical protein
MFSWFEIACIYHVDQRGFILSSGLFRPCLKRESPPNTVYLMLSIASEIRPIQIQPFHQDRDRAFRANHRRELLASVVLWFVPDRYDLEGHGHLRTAASSCGYSWSFVRCIQLHQPFEKWLAIGIVSYHEWTVVLNGIVSVPYWA